MVAKSIIIWPYFVHLAGTRMLTKMVIVVNTRLLLKDRLEGIGRFTYETFRRITASHPEHRFIFVFDRPFSPEFVFSDNITPVVAGPPARHPLLWLWWFEMTVPAVLKKYKADVFVSPDGYLSLRTGVPQHVVMHDINFVHRPADLPWLTSKYYNYFFPRFASKSVRMATVSEFSGRDISVNFRIQPGKIDVVYNGYNPDFRPLGDDEIREVRGKYSGGHPYFLFVGALHPRKNIEGLLTAFEQYKRATGRSDKLLIAGGQMFKTGSISSTWRRMQAKDEVIFAGRVSDKELRRLYGGALCLVFVPFFEGFGIPVIEAMSAGIPVICSNTTSLPEVGGDAVHYVEPSNAGMIADAMEKISTDADYRQMLTGRGAEQKERFSWDKSALMLWKSIETAVETARQHLDK